ncbi:hypothetical protein MIB92_08315 [Aestuariirhabdus sp. Z084]|uniref:hypothetical protein n=1 Tax=Aestuariirhabdus haliotis TaxID=2918751 RepID=UPI00201B4019|nr:hypothetical protein [Aestuariirhabdus haliotis]MCL6415652.1 hypothetical protein [Aestuariirhabdus haliotis]MCL6419647.1 hypothetical protein [Aestuariirhabdus haliotis]
MNLSRWLSLSLLSSLWLPGLHAQAAHPPLQLLHSLPIDAAVPDLQPSGLAWCNGKLLTLSDRHDQQIFRIEFNPQKVTSTIGLFRSLQSPPAPEQETLKDRAQALVSGRRFDWEGISCQNDSLYLLSEQFHDVLQIKPDTMQWLALPQQDLVGVDHLLVEPNAGLEGISWNQAHLLLAAERDQRGLLQLNYDQSSWHVSLRLTPLPPQPPIAGRNPDFSGLWYEAPWLYTLERNLFRVCQRGADFQQRRCWSYAHTELAPDQRFQSQYGVAEGIAADATRIYLITDNNNKPLISNPDDRRPRLWIFAKPDDWGQ